MSEIQRYMGWTEFGSSTEMVKLSDYDALADQRDEGLAREAELREQLRTQTLRADAAVGDANDAERHLVHAQELVEEIELACSTYKQLRPLRSKALAFLTRPKCSRGKKS